MIGPNVLCTLQSLSITVDSLGSQIESYANVKSVYGVLTRPSRIGQTEIQLNNKQTVVADYMFFIDYDLSISFSEKDSLVYGNRIFDILLVYEPGTCAHHY